MNVGFTDTLAPCIFLDCHRNESFANLAWMKCLSDKFLCSIWWEFGPPSFCAKAGREFGLVFPSSSQKGSGWFWRVENLANSSPLDWMICWAQGRWIPTFFFSQIAIDVPCRAMTNLLGLLGHETCRVSTQHPFCVLFDLTHHNRLMFWILVNLVGSCIWLGVHTNNCLCLFAS